MKDGGCRERGWKASLLFLASGDDSLYATVCLILRGRVALPTCLCELSVCSAEEEIEGAQLLPDLFLNTVTDPGDSLG